MISRLSGAENGSYEKLFSASVIHLKDTDQLDISLIHGDGSNTVVKKGGPGIGYSGHKHQKGDKELTIVDNNGFVLGPIIVKPVNEQDMTILPESLTDHIALHLLRQISVFQIRPQPAVQIVTINALIKVFFSKP